MLSLHKQNKESIKLRIPQHCCSHTNTVHYHVEYLKLKEQFKMAGVKTGALHTCALLGTDSGDDKTAMQSS